MYSNTERLPYIKVKYKQDDPVSGTKKGEVVPIAYHAFSLVPPPLRERLELVEGPSDIRELKEMQIEHKQRGLEAKLIEIEALKAELAEEDAPQEEGAPPKKKVAKKRKR